MGNVHISLKSTGDWSGSEKAQALADILSTEDDFWAPEKLDSREPPRFVFDPGNLAKFFELWTSDIGWVLLMRRKPHLAWLNVKIWPREARQFNYMLGGFDERYFKKAERVARLLTGVERLVSWGAVDHGYVAHETDWNTKNYLGMPTVVTSGKAVSTGGMWLEQHLPGIYWANFFGPIYVQFFGVTRFRTAPAFAKQELPDGGFLLLTAPDPLRYADPEVHKLEQAIIDHLGREAFFERTNPKKPAHAPEFAFRQAASGEPVGVQAYDPVVQAIPDPDDFVRNAARLADELVRSLPGRLDYAPSSLESVDNLILKRSAHRPEPWQDEAGRRLVRQFTAYYGEVLRRNLDGRWAVLPGSSGSLHAAVVVRISGERDIEYPFTRIAKLWSERQRADGLSVRYHLLATGQLRRMEKYLSNRPS